MVNAKNSQVILEKFFKDCVKYWMKQKENDKIEAYKNTLEHDFITLYKMNNGCLHDPYVPTGDELDKTTTLKFIQCRCQDLYGKNWEKYWKEYNLQ